METILSSHPVGLAVERLPPSEAPEDAYRHNGLVSRLVREAVLHAGFQPDGPCGTFGQFIRPGMTVLLKPNWVYHDNRSGHGMSCLVTHPGLILAVLDEVLKAKPGRVVLGDAPLQSCVWDAVVTAAFQAQARNLGSSHGVEVAFVDFRRSVIPSGRIAQGVRSGLRDEERYVLFDLGRESLLEPVSEPAAVFRVSDYDFRRLAERHHRGTHQYLLCREAFEADVILSLPKLKTHCRAGLTGALKNLVGLNGNKDFLPHQRAGGAGHGGDSYCGKSLPKQVCACLRDRANRVIGRPAYGFWRLMASIVWRAGVLGADRSFDGCWHGNDTCWRMVLDLNRILLYGRSDGTLAPTVQRRLYSLTDGIVCGEGNGPLSPDPVLVGAVTFSDSAPEADAVHAALLGFDYRRMALTREAFGDFRWPLTQVREPPGAHIGGGTLSLDEIARQFGVRARPPEGWAGHIELR
jgi:uncharacterized protein (DUF362 family)